MGIETRRPSLAETWFVERAAQSLDGLCQFCRQSQEAEIRRFGNTTAEGLSAVYKLSLALHVDSILSGKGGVEDDGWEVMRLMGMVKWMAGASQGIWALTAGDG